MSELFFWHCRTLKHCLSRAQSGKKWASASLGNQQRSRIAFHKYWTCRSTFSSRHQWSVSHTALTEGLARTTTAHHNPNSYQANVLRMMTKTMRNTYACSSDDGFCTLQILSYSCSVPFVSFIIWLLGGRTRKSQVTLLPAILSVFCKHTAMIQ